MLRWNAQQWFVRGPSATVFHSAIVFGARSRGTNWSGVGEVTVGAEQVDDLATRLDATVRRSPTSLRSEVLTQTNTGRSKAVGG